MFLSLLIGVLVSINIGGGSIAQESSLAGNLEYKGENKNLAVMVTDAMHFHVAVETAEQLNLKASGINFEIVIVGALAKEIVEDSSVKENVEKAISSNADLVVCEYALNMLKVDKGMVDKRIKITPNAWIYMFELQDRGFHTLTIQP